MNITEAIRRAVPILAEHGSTDFSMLPIWLIRGGLSRAHAHDAMRFIPLAFGREILAGMGVVLADTYVRVSDGKDEERPLADEPFFVEASKLVTAFAPDLFSAVAMQSSEFQAVNQALHAGAQPDGLVASPPMIEWDRPVEEPSARPWWKFWS
jgi:hypothetical protein